MSEARIFSAFVRNDLVDGQKILVLECLAQDGYCTDGWGGEHYEFPFDRISAAPPHILHTIGTSSIIYPQISQNLGYRTLHPEEEAEVRAALTQAKERAARAA